jgi:hypothetical protein
MKRMQYILAAVLCVASATAFACPKGTHLVGGTGAHHKGGKCVAQADAKAPAAAEEKTTDAKADKKAKKSKADKKAETAK